MAAEKVRGQHPFLAGRLELCDQQRLAIAAAIAKTLVKGMDILGIQLPERM